MIDSAVLGVVPNWVSNWLTPVWLVGVGALAGLALLTAVWLLMFGLSRIRLLATISEQPALRNRVAFAVSLLIFLGWGGWALASGWWTAGPRAGGVQGSDTPMLVLLLALGSLLGGFTLVSLTSRRAVDEVTGGLREGPLWPILLCASGLAAFGVFGYFVATKPRDILASLQRLPYAGTSERIFTIPAASQAVLDDPAREPPQHAVDVNVRRSELKRLTILSSQNVTIDAQATDEFNLHPLFRLSSNELLTWTASGKTVSPFENEQISQLFVRNYGTQDATLNVTLVTSPPNPQVATVLITALSLAGICLLYLTQRTVMPKLSAVALATLKSEIAQPLFLIVVMVGLFSLVMFIFIPFNTLGEDIKVLKDSGMTLIMVLGIIQAIWASSTSISEEIDGRTALTVLSKPIGRRSFILGKFLGIFWTVAVIFIILALVFMVVVAYKPIYDAKENSQDEAEAANWQVCHLEMTGVVPGLVLAFMETVVLAALSVAVSTRLPMLANFIICFTVYVMGHLTPLIVQSSVGKFAPVQFVAELLSAVLPILDHFNITAAVSTGVAVPYHYLGWALVYSLLYGVISLLLALLLFEDRDLA